MVCLVVASSFVLEGGRWVCMVFCLWGLSLVCGGFRRVLDFWCWCFDGGVLVLYKC